MKTLKNYWLVILGTLAVIADTGLDAINPILSDLNLDPKIMTWLKVIFAIYGIVKLKTSLPTQNMDKLQDIVDSKQASDGAVLPPKGL